jgi:hypothetical protein
MGAGRHRRDGHRLWRRQRRRKRRLPRFPVGRLPGSWFADPRFLIGIGLFFVGAAINLTADQTLLALRRPGAPDYSIPRDGLFRFEGAFSFV